MAIMQCSHSKGAEIFFDSKVAEIHGSNSTASLLKMCTIGICHTKLGIDG